MRWILVLLAAIISGAVIGAALYFLDVKVGFYLVVLFPLFGGVLIGAATFLPVVTKNVPSFPLILAGVIGCAIAVVVYWGGQYLAYQDEIVSIVQQEDPSATREEALALLDKVNESDYGTTGFMAFLKAYSETGITINRSVGSSSSGGIELKDNIAYGFWIFEIVVMLGAAVVTVLRRDQSGIAKRLKPQSA